MNQPTNQKPLNNTPKREKGKQSNIPPKKTKTKKNPNPTKLKEKPTKIHKKSPKPNHNQTPKHTFREILQWAPNLNSKNCIQFLHYHKVKE